MVEGEDTIRSLPGGGGDDPGGVVRFGPGLVSTGQVPTVRPGPRSTGFIFKYMLKILGFIMLFAAVLTFWLVAFGLEIFFDHFEWEEGVSLQWRALIPTIALVIIVTMCIIGGRALLFKDDLEMGYIAAVVNLIAVLFFMIPYEMGDILVIDLPGGACGIFPLIVSLALVFFVFLHWMRRRRRRLAIPDVVEDEADGYGHQLRP